jgi:hypothetical protein
VEGRQKVLTLLSGGRTLAVTRIVLLCSLAMLSWPAALFLFVLSEVFAVCAQRYEARGVQTSGTFPALSTPPRKPKKRGSR